jgi:hypothetical protein
MRISLQSGGSKAFSGRKLSKKVSVGNTAAAYNEKYQYVNKERKKL